MQQLLPRITRSACPHDCPSACALEVPVRADGSIGRIRGARENSYTRGVVCSKVARYAERIEHPDRLLHPLRRTGPKNSGQFERISWDDALDEIAGRFADTTARSSPEAVWPYHSGGNMGVLQRYGIDRLRNTMRYSRQQTTICVTPAESVWLAGVGKLVGPDPREMEHADLIVIWGANPVSTQVNVMTHVTRARRARGARLIVVDVYRSPTIEQADTALIVKPGTDAALALAVMNVLLTNGLADREYLQRYTDFDEKTERHILTRTPQWASEITGVPVEEIIAFARAYGSTRRSFIRVGFGFTRTRNGSSAMHAVSCLPAMTGAWKEKGGGAFFLTFDRKYWGLDTTLLHGLDVLDPSVRVLDQSRIGAVLCGEPHALKGGPRVEAMLIQNANSATVAPDTGKVLRGLGREDLFLAVQEQFLTPTARYADIVLPATMFVEHDDIYYGLGHTHLTFGPKLVEPRGEARPNSYVVRELGGGSVPGTPASHSRIASCSMMRCNGPSCRTWLTWQISAGSTRPVLRGCALPQRISEYRR